MGRSVCVWEKKGGGGGEKISMDNDVKECVLRQ